MELRWVGSIGQFSIVVLSLIFLISFAFFVLPRFPSVLEGSGGREWFIVSWNLPGPLMFISVFRIHALRRIQELASRRRKVLGITRWVRFWFVVSVTFGALSLAFLLLYTNPASLKLLEFLSVLLVIALWAAVVGSSLLLRLGSYRNPRSIEALRKRERCILGLTSVVFLIFTTLSSIALSFPIR
jgi:hypothetical protein